MVEYDETGVIFTIPEDGREYEFVISVPTPANEIANAVPPATDSAIEEAVSMNEAQQPSATPSAMSDVESLAPTPRITKARPRSRRAQAAAVITSSPFKAQLLEKQESSARKGHKKQLDSAAAKTAKKSQLRNQSKKVSHRAEGQSRKKKMNEQHDSDDTPCSICSKRYNVEPFLAFVQCSKCGAWYCEPCGPSDIDMCYSCLP